MSKIDLKKELKELYTASSKRPNTVKVAPANFLMIDGQGNPNTSPDFEAALAALYHMAYTVKSFYKKKDRDFVVPPMEGLWWMDDMNDFTLDNKDQWRWTLMIRLPDFVTKDTFDKALEEVRAKKNPARLDELRFERYEEGLSAQIMHIGPYSTEHETIVSLHQFIADRGCQTRGKHHEIYLSDPRRADPKNMKTILRQPITCG